MWNRFIQITTFWASKLLARLLPPRRQPLPRQARLILVFSTIGIGDGLFDSAAIHSLKLGHPSAKLIVCAHRTRQAVALHNPFVDEVVPFGKSPLRQLRLIWRFRRNRPDIVVVLHVNEEVYPLAYWINRNATVTYANLYERFAFLAAHPVKVEDTRHDVLMPLKVARYAGGSTVAPRMIYEVKAEESVAIRRRFADWIDHPYVVFQTGGGRIFFWRDWPVENYVTIIRWFSDHFPHKVILTGGVENLERANAMERAYPGVINLAGKTTLAETAALLQLTKMLLTTDTGILHLGFAIGCPVVCLLHDMCPAENLCPLDRSAPYLALQLKRSHPRPPPNARDMEGISSDEVKGAIARVLGAQ